jgi:hypothetical protein
MTGLLSPLLDAAFAREAEAEVKVAISWDLRRHVRSAVGEHRGSGASLDKLGSACQRSI